MKILALIIDTFREIYAKKIIIGIIVIELIAIAITASVLFSDTMQDLYAEASAPPSALDDSLAKTREIPFTVPDDTVLLGSDAAASPDSADHDRGGRQEPSRTFQTDADAVDADALPGMHRPVLAEMVKGQLGMYAPVFTLAALFIGIFMCAGIVPAMMEKGAIDLLISKPLPRTALLLGRALGGFLALALNVTGFVVVVWTLYGMATSVWHTPFLVWTIVIPLFTFLVLYSGIILLNVLTESWVLPMSLAYVHLMILSNFLASRETLLFEFIGNTILQGTITGLYYVLPQTTDLIRIVQQGVFTSSVDTAAPFVQGALFMAVALGYAAWKFQRKDF